MSTRILVAVLTVVVSSQPAWTNLQYVVDVPHVEVTYLGRIPQLVQFEGCMADAYPRNLAVSQQGNRLAYWAKQGSKYYVVVDGKRIGEYGWVDNIMFSPDGSRYAFVAVPRADRQNRQEARKQVLVLDGLESARYDSVNVPRFSQNGKRIGFLAQRGSRKFPWVDGMEFSEYEDADMVVFSRDGKSFAFRGRRGDKEYVVVNGKPSPPYDEVGIVEFVGPHDELVYWAKWGNKWRLLLNRKHILATEELGRPVKTFFTESGTFLGYTVSAGQSLGFLKIGHHAYGPIDSYWALLIRFSADGRHHLCVLRRGQEDFVAYDGREFGPFEEVAGIALSEDGKRWAYAASKGGKFSLVVDGVEVGKYSYVYTPIFCPDGKRWACIAVRDGKHIVIVDGVEQAEFDHASHLIFSADGKKMAYWAGCEGGRFVVVNNVQLTPVYEKVRPMSLRFAPDGQRLVWWAEAYEQQTVLVGVDSEIIGSAPGSYVIFYRDTPHTMQYTLRKGLEVWKVTLRLR